MNPHAVFLVANVLTAVAFLAIAVFIAPRFMVGTNHAEGATLRQALNYAWLLRMSAIVLFLGVAARHFVMAYWTLRRAPEWHVSWYSFTIVSVELLAGALFLLLGAKVFHVRVMSVLAPNHKRPPRNIYARWWPRVRDMALFSFGLRGAIEQSHRARGEISIELLALYAAAMGLPLVLRGAHKPTPLGNDVEAIDPATKVPTKVRVEIAPLNNELR